jgi:hypothetical protein
VSAETRRYFRRRAEAPMRKSIPVLGASSAGQRNAGVGRPADVNTVLGETPRTAGATGLGLPLPGSETVAAMLATLSAQGAGGLGWQALFRRFETDGGFSLQSDRSVSNP